MEDVKYQLTNGQLEILKKFNYKLTEEELKAFRIHIARFFAEKAMDAADSVWEKENWDNHKVDHILESKLR